MSERNDSLKRNYATHHKLNEKQVVDLYEAFKRRQKDEFELARYYKISLSAVYDIIGGRSWRWLNLKPLYRKEMD